MNSGVSGLMDVDERLKSLAQRLCMRPGWKNNYQALAGGSDLGDARVQLALLKWLQVEFAALKPDEVVCAEKQLVTQWKFAPDTSDILQVMFQTAAERRYGDPFALYQSLVAKTTRWLSGSKEEWLPIEAWLVREIGARAICESVPERMQERVAQGMRDFVRENEPDVRSDAIFARREKDADHYANAPRKVHDFASLRELLNHG